MKLKKTIITFLFGAFLGSNALVYAAPAANSLQKQIRALQNQIKVLQQQIVKKDLVIKDLQNLDIVKPLDLKYSFNGIERVGQYNDGNVSIPQALNFKGSIYAPVKFITENLEKSFSYDSKAKTVFVGTKPEGEYMVDIIKPYDINIWFKSFSNFTDAMMMGGKKYYKGYQTGDSEGKLSFNLENKYKTISGTIGLDDYFNDNDSTLEVYGDGMLIEKFEFKKGCLPRDFSLNVQGVLKLDFVKTAGYTQIDFANVIIK